MKESDKKERERNDIVGDTEEVYVIALHIRLLILNFARRANTPFSL
jgi:hypothetical protein